MLSFDRRALLAGIGTAFLSGSDVLHLFAAQNPAAKKKRPNETGREQPDFAAVDAVMKEVMSELHIAGASLAVAHDGKIVVERPFGLAEVEQRMPVRPETHFSIASVTKPFTGIGVLKLVDERKLRLDARLVDVLKAVRPERPITDPR